MKALSDFGLNAFCTSAERRWGWLRHVDRIEINGLQDLPMFQQHLHSLVQGDVRCFSSSVKR
jgi:hypothetical protein